MWPPFQGGCHISPWLPIINPLIKVLLFTLAFSQNYQISRSYRDAAGLHTLSVTAKSNQTQYTFKYLQFNTTYTFEVQTKFQDSKLSDPVSIKKTIGSFSAPVGPLKAIIHADSSVTLSWSSPPSIDPKKVGR